MYLISRKFWEFLEDVHIFRQIPEDSHSRFTCGVIVVIGCIHDKGLEVGRLGKRLVDIGQEIGGYRARGWWIGQKVGG